MLLSEISLFNKIINSKILFNQTDRRNAILGQCENNEKDEDKIIKLLENISNSYLICQIVENNLHDIFFEEIDNIFSNEFLSISKFINK